MEVGENKDENRVLTFDGTIIEIGFGHKHAS